MLKNISKNTIWRILSIVLPIFLSWVITYFLVISGFDWWYFLSVRNNSLNQIFFPALILGFLIPVISPIIILIYAKIKKDLRLQKFAWGLGLSAFLGWCASSFIKTFTGRLQPNLHNLNVDISHAFNFGIFKHGIFWGWPSSHTCVAFSVSFYVIYFINNISKNKNYSKNNFIIIIVFLYALYVGIGVSLSIHWFSDFITGAILGTIIGMQVGKNLYK